MKVNPNYLGRLFTEHELIEEEKAVSPKNSCYARGEGSAILSAMHSPVLEEWSLPIGAYYCRECLVLKPG